MSGASSTNINALPTMVEGASLFHPTPEPELRVVSTSFAAKKQSVG